MRDFKDINLVHVLREQNKCADFLAKAGTHSTISAQWESPPPELESLILFCWTNLAASLVFFFLFFVTLQKKKIRKEIKQEIHLLVYRKLSILFP